MDYSSGAPSPEIFRQWTAIVTVAAALERRVFTQTPFSKILPNMFVLLVAAPGVGKSQAIDPAVRLVRQSKKFYVSPSSLTKAALVDAMRESSIYRVTEHGLLEYHALFIQCPELGTLVPAHDKEFLSVLNYVYDNPAVLDEKRRSNNEGKVLEIINPTINILGGTQPGFLQELLPEAAWTMGFTSRMVLIYSNEKIVPDLFGEQRLMPILETDLVARLSAMSELVGRFAWSKPAAEAMQKWAYELCPPVPEHSRLEHYRPRRHITTIKLAMISAVSRTGQLTVELDDFLRAKAWLLDAEEKMPEIFRAMKQRSDAQVIDEMHQFAWTLYVKNKAPILQEKLLYFLHQRMPSDKAPMALEMAVKAGMFNRLAGTETYIPRPKHEHGME